MIYDKINEELFAIGTPKKFSDEEKFITPLYYDGGELNFSLKNKYIKIDKVEENAYGRDFITVKSKQYSDVITTIVNKLGLESPIQTDGSFRAVFNNKTKTNEPIAKIRDKTFNVCISLSFPTIYTDDKKKTLQIHLKDVVVVKIFNDELEVDLEKLEEAM